MAGVSQPVSRASESGLQSEMQPGWLWVAATAVPAIAIGVVLNLLILLQVGRNADSAVSVDIGTLPAVEYMALLVITGAAIAFAQLRVMRKSFGAAANKQVGWVISWIVGSLATLAALGGMTADTGSTGFEDVFGRLPWLLLPGVVLGIGQWYILKTQLKLKATEWWVLACIVGWAVGALVGYYVHTLLFNKPDVEYNMPYYPAGSMWAWSAGWAVGVLVFSAATGICIARIARQSKVEGKGIS